MTVDEALADVHQRFCSADGIAHDDACVTLVRSLAAPPLTGAAEQRLRGALRDAGVSVRDFDAILAAARGVEVAR